MANVGTFHRIFRAIEGLILLALPLIPATAKAFAGLGTWIWSLPVVGAVLLLTAIFRFCPAYTVLGVRTGANQVRLP
jgi:hypothetical protein